MVRGIKTLDKKPQKTTTLLTSLKFIYFRIILRLFLDLWFCYLNKLPRLLIDFFN